MDASTNRDPSDPLLGRLLDRRYRVGPRIARGGMASVYEAHDLRLDRVVAVKIMHPGLGDDDKFAQRFVREARHAARVSHPHVVAVHDQGDDDGTIYLAMEYIPGHTLRDVIRKEAPMSPLKALALLEPVLSALAEAHRIGLIHRDIKPENVLIADDGRVKVADFGLARAVSADTQHTATGGVLIGTVSYLAPELVVHGRSDARADVYAAGVVLYELLTGRKPHEGESPIQVAYQHVHADVPPPSALAPELPAYVDALVARATSRDLDSRPADARVLLRQAHRVRQALLDGVTDDPDLYDDLMPRQRDDSAADRGEDGDGEDGRESTTEVPEFDRTSAIEIGPDDILPVGETPAEARQVARDNDRVVTEQPAQVGATGRTTEHLAGGSGNPVRRPANSPPHTPPHPPASGGRGRRRRSLAILLAVLLVALIGVGGWWFGFARYTSTPGVIDLRSAHAQERVEEAGLDYKVSDRAYSETVPEGSIISSDPAPGDRVLNDGTVTVVVSLGKERYDVPVTRNKSEDEAQLAIQDANLTFGRTIERYSKTVDEGQIIGSNPKAGTPRKRDSQVDLYLSKGPPPVKVGAWVGKDADDAEEALVAKGLVVDRDTEEHSDSVDEGDVIRQDPSTGRLFPGETIKLVVSKGPVMVEVPNVVGAGTKSATNELEDAGFEVEVKRHPQYIGVGYVVSQSPTRGSEAAKGSTVTITIF